MPGGPLRLNAESNKIMATGFYILEKPLYSDQGLKERPRVATGQPSFARCEVEAETEKRLWKVCAEVASPGLSLFEWVALLVFGAASLGALAYGFYELFRLFHSGALDETVRALLTR